MVGLTDWPYLHVTEKVGVAIHVTLVDACVISNTTDGMLVDVKGGGFWDQVLHCMEQCEQGVYIQLTSQVSWTTEHSEAFSRCI